MMITTLHDRTAEEIIKENREWEEKEKIRLRLLENERMESSNSITLPEFIEKAKQYDIFKLRGYVCMRRRVADYNFDKFVRDNKVNSSGYNNKNVIHISKEYLIYIDHNKEDECIFVRKRG